MGTKNRIRTLDKLGLILNNGELKLHRLKKDEQKNVEVPRGEKALAKDLCARFDCKRIVLMYLDGHADERTSKGVKRGFSAAGTWLREQARK